jgi:hypothetical protein
LLGGSLQNITEILRCAQNDENRDFAILLAAAGAGGVAISHEPCIFYLMQEILFDYKLNPTTWAYVSTLMMIGIYFKFRRFWSVRNSDLLALIAFSPALLLIYYGLKQNPILIRTGYIWLFIISGIFLVRLLLDTLMVRRPLLEPNLSASGLTFTGISLLVFLMANVVNPPPERLESLFAKQAVPAVSNPGYVPFYTYANFSSRTIAQLDNAPPETHHQALMHAATTCTTTILAHLAVIVGIVWIGFRHFDNIHTGVAAASLYLLSFYISQFTGQVDHVAPAMLLVWAVAAYRRPLLAGILLGLAGGIIFYPLFLLPLWVGFYWRRGVVRFSLGVVLTLAALVAALALNSPDFGSFSLQLKQMFGWPFQATKSDFWQFYDSAFRIPLLAAFAALSLSFALWPAQKNLGTLLSCSAAVMLAAQFWLANHGGLYMAWYLPLLILTIFRPNLEDRVALSAVQPVWRRKV